ncbi:MAG: FAD-dependent oxidoreductase [Anaerolineales bacterium]|uniref:FAD-dependent oxidoreductase n=1 Tax=Candidatus Desulfolinea nitratireducens TaxID=2841698 RepID=A0A8J6TK32_9CHLR|nr:FAD-dependent oxidoreductase [Candidatus Desulfolinea nitratireducens]
MGEKKFQVAVIGAGPAGLFGARELAQAGAEVTLFNRDIKPGGLAEYGIYPNKFAMKKGLRKQFMNILETPNLHYFGNVTVGDHADLSLDELRDLGYQAIFVTIGAQGTKWLGLPGEDLTGVYHAKDVVYFYNHLPPFSQQEFRFGERCLVVGAGNVMMDIVRYLVRQEKVKEVTALVRRGPADVKFTKKELEYVAENLDLDALDTEIARVSENMRAVGQDPEAAKEFILSALPKAAPKISETKFNFQFLTSPQQMLGDEQKMLTSVEVEDNLLSLNEGVTKPRGTGETRHIEAETIIFAIGDKVDEDFGLPVVWSEFVKNEKPRFPDDGITYEAYDPASDSVIEDVFFAGWSRKASDGLVGYARKDGIIGANAVLAYLSTLSGKEPVLSALENKLASLSKPIVTNEAALRLYQIESEEASKRGIEEFKFSKNEDMLAAIGLVAIDL